jgi:hypothetical protein
MVRRSWVLTEKEKKQYSAKNRDHKKLKKKGFQRDSWDHVTLGVHPLAVGQ